MSLGGRQIEEWQTTFVVILTSKKDFKRRKLAGNSQSLVTRRAHT